VSSCARRAAPEDLAAGVAHAGVLQLTGSADLAVAEAERVLALDPDRETGIRVRMIAAAADSDQSRFAVARERLREALDLDPKRVDAVIMLAQAVVQGRGTRADFQDLSTRVDAALQGNVEDRERALLQGLSEQLHALNASSG
jgi:tetratricopeptide (TPR) repeat protein